MLEIIDQQRYLFQTLWNKSLSAEQKLKEIEEGIEPSTVDIANNPFDIQEQIFKLASSTKEELLGLFSTSNAFHRQQMAGRTSVAIKMAKEHNIKIRLLTPMDDKIEKLFDEIKSQNIDIEIKHIEKNFVSFALFDRKFSLILELKDNTKNNTYEATGNAIYSNSPSTVLFYVSIFESFWQQAILYENTQNELKKTKTTVEVFFMKLNSFIDKGLFLKNRNITTKFPVFRLLDLLIPK